MLTLLPHTARDALATIHPYLVEAAEKDGAFIAKAHPDLETLADHGQVELPCDIAFVQDGYIEAILDRGVQRTGYPREVLEDELARNGLPAEASGIWPTFDALYPALVNYERWDRKTFHISDALTARLAVTEANIQIGQMHLPFPAFLIVFTDPLATELLYRQMRAERPRIAQQPLPDAPISIFVQRVQRAEDAHPRLIVTTVIAERLDRTHAAFHHLGRRQLHLDPDWDIERSLRTDWDEVTPGDTLAETGSDASREFLLDDATFYDAGLGFYRFVMNTILYLTSRAAEREVIPSPVEQLQEVDLSALSRKAAKTLRRRAEAASPDPHEKVGRSVQPIRYSQNSGSDGAPSIRTIDKRFLVRGHWRNQAVGPGRRERALIWIEPHWKGPDLAEITSRPYLVDAPDRTIVRRDPPS